MYSQTIFQFGLEASLSGECGDALEACGYRVVRVATRRDLERLDTSREPALAIVDDADGVGSGARTDLWGLSLIVLATVESEARAVRALRTGALDYFRWPRDRAAFLDRVRQLVPPTHDDLELDRGLVGRSAAIQRVRLQIGRAAVTDCNVLLVGETGTGKELAAGLVHALSPRAAQPFVAMNCAAIPESLLESELFGHERGAFTGAVKMSEGKLRQADRGTLFLDEVGDLSLMAQAKLLRAFESRTIVRLGGQATLPVNARFVAATNMDLAAAAKDGRFRADLFYRLNVAEVAIPPLRERPDDIGPLVDFYVRHCNRRFHRQGQAFAEEVIRGFEKHSWPGNVRELRNVVEATFVNSTAKWLSWSDLPLQFRRYFPPPLERAVRGERDLLFEALADAQGNKTKAAESLRCSRMSIYRKLAKYGVRPE